VNWFVSAVYPDVPSAREVADDLVRHGFPPERISVLAKEEHREALTEERDDASGHRAREGAAAGGVIGAIAGGLVGLASLGVPGGIVVGGPIAAFLGGATVGAAGAGLLGALIGLGLPEEEARTCEQCVRDGGVLVAVALDSPDKAADAEALLCRGHPCTRAHVGSFGSC